MAPNSRVFVISLGCAKNRVDSEHILGWLKSQGYEPAVRLHDAEVAVINTCGFVQAAVEEAIETILEVADLKRQGTLQRIVVAGCFVQRYGYKLARELPEVDGWLGTGELHRIGDILSTGQDERVPFHIGRPRYLADHHTPRLQTTPFYTSYLKIAEGCSHTCTYCIIPRLRGPFRSRELDSLVTEAERMAESGVIEINLVAQDTTMYGRDLKPEVCLEDLLERLLDVKGLKWIRLLYCHPERVSDRLLELMDSEEVICPYLDVPQQHVNERLLRLMGRGCGDQGASKLIDRVRSRRRKISLRTSLMVGFPGETDKMFRELCDFVMMAQFDHLGVFVFSPEKGAPSSRLKRTVSLKEARRRRDRLMALQAAISERKNQRMIGRVLPVLVEGPCTETDLLLTGRLATMAPDVDGQVLINKGEGKVGAIMPVRITEAHTYDLLGEILE
jgi:ribosomal protein S12 methylthiotransferase